MKKLAQFLLGFSLISALFVSCSDNDDNLADYNNYSITKDILQKNNWTVNDFKFNNQSNDTQFNGFKFTFYPDGVVTAVNGTIVHSGSYRLYDSNDNSESLYDIRLLISLQPSSSFSIIAKDWGIVKRGNKVLEFSCNENNNKFDLSVSAED